MQKESQEGEEHADIIMLTHVTREKHVNAAIGRIEKLPTITGAVTRIRTEELNAR